MVADAFVSVRIGVRVVGTSFTVAEDVPDFSGGTLTSLDTFSSLWIWAEVVRAGGTATCCLEVALARAVLLLASSISRINVVVFLTTYTLPVLNVVIGGACLARTQLVQDLPSRAVGRVIHACLPCFCLWIAIVLTVLASSILLDNLPVRALLQITGAASSCRISVCIVQAVLTFTNIIKALSFSTGSRVIDALTASFIGVAVGSTVVAFSINIEYLPGSAGLLVGYT